MKIEKLKERLSKNRPMVMVSLRMPQDVVDDLKRVAPLKGFSGYQPLIRAYVGQGLRHDLEQLELEPQLSELVDMLRSRGVSEETLATVVAESKQ